MDFGAIIGFLMVVVLGLLVLFAAGMSAWMFGNWVWDLFFGDKTWKEESKKAREKAKNAPKIKPGPVDQAKAIEFIENSKLSPLAESLVGLLEPCIAVDAKSAGDLSPEASRLGGRPGVPAGFEWPVFKKKPLDFLAQLRMKDVKTHDPTGLLPDDGWIYFFYYKDGGWGFDPKDRESFRVLFVAQEEALSFADVPKKLKPFHECRLKFSSVMTLPSQGGPGINEVTEFIEENDLYDEFSDLETDVLGGRVSPHHLFGHPQPVQDDEMYVECQLVANGHNLGKGYPDLPEIDKATACADDWILLFQIDSDEEAGWMWGDAGTLYFWIRKEDLKSRAFEKAWMILQCC